MLELILNGTITSTTATTSTITTTTTTTTTNTQTTITATTITSTTTTISTTTQTTITSTTTTILPVNAVCDPHNDHCELAKGLCCDLDAYQCRYTDDGARCIGDMTTASMTTVTTRTKPAIPTATKTKTTRATTAAVATKTETAPKGSTATATTRILPIPPTLHPAANHRLPVYAYGAFGGSVLVLILGVSTACYCLQKQKLWRLKLRYGNDTNDDDDDDDDVQLLNLEGINTNTTSNNDYFDPQMTLKRKSVTLDKVIGEGNFGKVFSGTAKDPQRGDVVVAVAVKSPSAGARIDFEAEMEIMGQLTRLGGHQHIVSVVGCVYGKEPLLVLELCAGGSLKTALIASKKHRLRKPQHQAKQQQQQQQCLPSPS